MRNKADAIETGEKPREALHYSTEGEVGGEEIGVAGARLGGGEDTGHVVFFVPRLERFGCGGVDCFGFDEI